MRANLILLLGTLTVLFGADRLLLHLLQPSLWVPDTALHYVHRPNARLHWSRAFQRAPLHTNAYGHHGPDLPLAKPRGQKRIAFLGDSVVMGHGLPYTHTLAFHASQWRDSVQWRGLNGGVQGYATRHYPEVLRRMTAFSPDVAVLVFCLNDLTHPFHVEPEWGGTGTAYHGMDQRTTAVLSYLRTDTGFGRLAHVVALRFQSRFAPPPDESAELEAFLALPPDHPRAQTAWRFVLRDLNLLREEALRQGIPLQVAVTPHRFQYNTSAPHTLAPLDAWAASHGVGVMYLKPFLTPERDLMDHVHYTPEGHARVSEILRREVSVGTY